MDFYNNLNEMINYIEDNLENEIDYKKLALIVGVSEFLLPRLFSIISNVSLTEYIRKRRLTLAGKDLVQLNMKVLDVAMKYGYNSSTTFSRAFFKFHGIHPSEVKRNVSKLKYYPQLKFEKPNLDHELEYEIVSLDQLVLYGIGIKTNNKDIKKDAPNLFLNIAREYSDMPHPDYGMVVYKDRFNSVDYQYWVLWRDAKYNFKKVVIEASRWLKFKVNSQNALDIQKMSESFYFNFLPNCNYTIRDVPELEYYHDGITEFLVPII